MQTATSTSYLPTIPEKGWRMFDFFSTPIKPYIRSCTLATICIKDCNGNPKKIVYTMRRASAWGDRTVILTARATNADGYKYAIESMSLGYMFDPMSNVFQFKADWEKRDDFISFEWSRPVKQILQHAGLA